MVPSVTSAPNTAVGCRAAAPRPAARRRCPGGWLPLSIITVFFSIITPPGHPPRQLQQCKELAAAIERFVDGWYERRHTFVWTKTADELLDHCRPGQRTSFTRH